MLNLHDTEVMRYDLTTNDFVNTTTATFSKMQAGDELKRLNQCGVFLLYKEKTSEERSRKEGKNHHLTTKIFVIIFS